MGHSLLHSNTDVVHGEITHEKVGTTNAAFSRENDCGSSLVDSDGNRVASCNVSAAQCDRDPD